jgi:serine/threonine protein kinase
VARVFEAVHKQTGMQVAIKLEGETLADVLRSEERLNAARLVDWVGQLLVGVRDCHRANAIHRDIKPAKSSRSGRAVRSPS